MLWRGALVIGMELGHARQVLDGLLRTVEEQRNSANSITVASLGRPQPVDHGELEQIEPVGRLALIRISDHRTGNTDDQ
ncbi:hypothetical protein ABGB14_41660 [Nonomuraea sp. B10E15]|uniref:hypothetical protein n=1 Tax=Nonomuraea sp. B10E15 TaxID=3153560 RepID=UPI00325F2BEB